MFEIFQNWISEGSILLSHYALTNPVISVEYHFKTT